MCEPPSFSRTTRSSCSTPSAHALGRIDYLQEALAPERRASFDRKAATDWSKKSDGSIVPQDRPGRKDPCSCRSGDIRPNRRS
jgi:hypothetical protein